MKTITRFLAIVVLVLSTSMSGAAPAPKLAAGDIAPPYAGHNYDGDPTSPADFKGKVVVISFWASWCGPCLKEIPMLEGIQRTAGKNQIRVIAINIEASDVYRRLVRKLPSYEMLLTHDRGRDGSELFGVNGIPHMLIINREGKIVKICRGYSEEDLDGIIDDINRALLTK